MASEIRVNQIQSRTGVSTISFTETGPIISGVTTITGDLDVTGLVSYDDVTNIDSVGIITARNDINIENATPTLNLIDTDGSTTASFLGNSGNIFYSTSSSNRDHIFRGSTTEVVRITGDGKFGVGTNNPTETLTLNHANGASIGLEYSGTENGTINVNSAAMYVRAGTGKHLILGSNGTEKLRISSDGKVVISRFDDGSAGPYLELYNNSESPADNDYTGSITFKNNNSASEEILYAEIRGISRDITDGSEDGEIQFHTERNGNFGERVRICADQGTNFNESRLDIIGGNTNVANVDEINGSLRFRSNDASVNSTENVGAQISAVTEASNGAYVGLRFYTFEQGGRGLAESLRITHAGRIGINQTSPNAPLSFNTGAGQKIELYNSGSNNEFGFGIQSSEMRICTGASSFMSFYTDGYNGNERLRIDADGTLLVNASVDNTGGHGRIVAHAPTSGNTIYKAIEIGNTNGNGTARGAAICGQPKSNSHLPYTLLGSWDHGDNTDCYYGGGWGGAMRPATRHRFYTNSSYPTSGGSGTENMTLNGNGHLTLPNHPSFGCIKNGNQYPVNGQRSVITPWTEHFDQGGHFNASTGVFTAPVQGKYYFYVSVMMDRNDNGDYQISIYRNGSVYYNSNDMLSNSGVTYMQTTICGVVEMSANDTVDFRMYNSSQTSSYIYQNHYTHCGGYLIG